MKKPNPSVGKADAPQSEANLVAFLKSDRLARHLESLARAKASPAAAHLDDLALASLVSIEQFVQSDSTHPDARKTLEYCKNAREANSSMRANYWLSKAKLGAYDYQRSLQPRMAARQNRTKDPIRQKMIDVLVVLRSGNATLYEALEAMKEDTHSGLVLTYRGECQYEVEDENALENCTRRWRHSNIAAMWTEAGKQIRS